MNSIIIRKYEYQADRAKNYFASPTFIDGIELTNIHVDGFPIFNEEFQNQFDSFEFVASDFDLVFSRLEDTLTTSGETLEAFLSHDLDNHCLACKVDISGKVFGGLIDVNSIKFIDNLDSDGYKIQLTIFDWAKEFSLATQCKPFQPRLEDTYINSYLKTTSTVSQTPFFALIGEERLPEYFFVNVDDLDWYNRIGYEPVLITELWAFLCDENRTDGVVIWKLFEDLCKAFGLIYKFNMTGDYINYFEVTMSLAFRDTGFNDANEVSLDWITRERGYISDINANTIQCFKFMKEQNLNINGEPIEEHFYGVVFNKDNVATYDGDIPSGYTFEEGIYSNGDGMTLVKLNDPFPFNVADKVNYVEMNYYFDSSYLNGNGSNVSNYVIANSNEQWYTDPQIRKPKVISFPRMFTKAGYFVIPYYVTGQYNITIIGHTENIHNLWASLVEGTCGECYKYLLSTFKMYAQGKISLMSSFDINLFDYDTIGHSRHKIFKLSNLDKQNREVDVYMVSD